MCNGPILVIRRRIVCGPACAEKRHEGQLLAQRMEKSAKRKSPPSMSCEVCSTPFAPRNSRAKYCEDQDCKAIGLLRSIDEQKKRRQTKKEGSSAEDS